MATTALTENPLTFTKLFCERNGTTFAAVLHDCFTTPELLDTFNRVTSSRLVCEVSGGQGGARRIQCLQAGVTREKQIDRFAQFVWREVFLML